MRRSQASSGFLFISTLHLSLLLESSPLQVLRLMFIFLYSVQWDSFIYPLPSPAHLVLPDTRIYGLPHIPSPLCSQPLDRNSFLRPNQSSLTFSRRYSIVGQAGDAERLVSLQLGPQGGTWRLPAWRFVLIAVLLGCDWDTSCRKHCLRVSFILEVALLQTWDFASK